MTWRPAAALLAVLLTAPSTAQAVPGGAPLNVPPSTNSGCEALVIPVQGQPTPPSCTLLGIDPAGTWTSQTPRGNWVITTARVRTGPRVGPMVFTVIRATRSQAGTGAGRIICCSVPVESQVLRPRPNAINEVPVRLPVKNTVEVIGGEPIEVVDYLGISLLDLSSSGPVAASSNETVSWIAPALRQGGEAIQGGAFNARVLVNGEYEPADAAGGGGGGGGGVADRVAPALTRLGLSRSRFAAAGRGGSIAAKVGTTIRYRQSEAATVTFRVRRKGARKPLKGSFAHRGKAGANKLRFTGRLRGKKLRRGSYVLSATSKDAAGNVAKVKRLRFRIVKR
ncbi:MAG TPA: hypothetical protein VFY44_10805 [Thermoleophilaceae bacterium]|nr:hypothetical protein [Thermoleophilaceae bacterium]